MLEIKVKYFADIEPIKFIENKSDWYDLRSAEDVEMKAGEFKLIKLELVSHYQKVTKQLLHQEVQPIKILELFKQIALALLMKVIVEITTSG